MKKEELDQFSTDSPNIPHIKARIWAGKKADPLFTHEVRVKGTQEPLSFNITIPLPITDSKSHHLPLTIEVLLSLGNRKQQQPFCKFNNRHFIYTLLTPVMNCNSIGIN